MDMNLRRLWEIVKDGESDMLQSMESQRVRHDLETEQQQQIYGGSFHRWEKHFFQLLPLPIQPFNSHQHGILSLAAVENSQWCYLTISFSAALFSFCLQSFPASCLFQWVDSLHQVVKILELQLQQRSFQRIFRVDYLWDWLVWSPCSPRDSQESSPTPQFKSINSSVLSFLLYSPTLSSIHDYWKKHSFDYTVLCH